MKNILSLVTGFFLLITFNAQAHFGSKGPFGGSVSCGIATGTAVYLGTDNGGVYESTTSAVTAWRARPVGLKSGKITSLAHTGSYLFASTADSGIYRFTGFVGSDRYWEKVNTGLGGLEITSLVAIDSITLIAGTAWYGVYKTIDKGANWFPVNNAVLHHYEIRNLVKAGNRIIHTSEGGVWASDDFGTTWIDYNDLNTYHVDADALSHNATTDELLVWNTDGLWISTSASTNLTPTYSSVQGALPISTIVYSISNNGTNWYLATNAGVFTSPTGTITWTNINSGISTLDERAVVPYSTDLIAGTHKDGIFKSPSSAILWSALNTNYNNLETYSMATSGASVIIAATEKGVFRSLDLATTYFRGNNGLTDSLHVNDLHFSGSNLYAATQIGGVFMSTDTAVNWMSMNSGLVNLNIKKLFSSGSSLFLINSTNEVFEYSGTSWTSIQTGLPVGVIPTSMAFFGAEILLGTNGHGVFTKPLTGGSWSSANGGLTNLNVTSVTASPTKIYAGTNGNGVFVSDTGTINWGTTSTTSIPHTTMIGLDGTKIQAMNYNAGYVFASYKGGLLATSDDGATWIQGGNQFNLPSYTAVNKIGFVTTRVFVTTENNSLYSNALSELPVITTGIEDQALNSNPLFNIYPNPNNGNFNITSTINNMIEEISIFDGLGKLIEQLTNFNADKIVTIDREYKPGVYFVRVKTTNGISTQKLIID